jgi:hypothetical protein
MRRQFTSRPPDPSPGPSPAVSPSGSPSSTPPYTRPGTACSTSGWSEEARYAGLKEDLKRIMMQQHGGSTSNSDRQSYVLLRRCEHPAVRSFLLSDAGAGVWKVLLTTMQNERNPLVIAQMFGALMVCAGNFRSESILREFVHHKKEISADSAASGSNNSATHRSLWKEDWSWNEAIPSAPDLYMQHLSQLLAPLLLSVHPQNRLLSGVLLKKQSVRSTATLQHVWAAGCEFTFAMLQQPRVPVNAAAAAAATLSSPSASCGASRIAAFAALCSTSFQNLSFPAALRIYVRHTLGELPLLNCSSGAIWRMLELAFELFSLSNKSKSNQNQLGFEKDAPLWCILQACWREICFAPTMRCCCAGGSAVEPANGGRGFEPFGASKHNGAEAVSPYLSLTAVLFRFLKQLIDTPAAAISVATLFDQLPILPLLLFHALAAHSPAPLHGESKTTRTDPANSIVADADYILTRFFLDPKNVLKLIPLVCAPPGGSSGAGFVSTLQHYLPAPFDAFLSEQLQNCPHVKYQRRDLQCIASFDWGGVASAASSATSLLPNSHSSAVISWVLSTWKKFLLFNLDGSTTPQQTPGNTSGSNVQVVRQMQSSKYATQIIAAQVQLLSDYSVAPAATTASSSAELRWFLTQLQSSLLSYFLSGSGSARGLLARGARVKDLFDLAAAARATPKPNAAGRMLFALGVRVVLCSVDALTAWMATSQGDSSSTGIAVGTTAPGFLDPLSSSASPDSDALMREVVALLLNDIRAVLSDISRLAPDREGGSEPPQLAVSDVFDLSYSADNTSSLPRIVDRPPSAYNALLHEVVDFLEATQARRFGMLPLSSSPPSCHGRGSPLSPSPPPPSQRRRDGARQFGFIEKEHEGTKRPMSSQTVRRPHQPPPVAAAAAASPRSATPVRVPPPFASASAAETSKASKDGIEEKTAVLQPRQPSPPVPSFPLSAAGLRPLLESATQAMSARNTKYRMPQTATAAAMTHTQQAALARLDRQTARQ